MALQSSGAISLSELQTEFGGSNPISLSEYYAGGGLVTSGLSYSNYTTGISGASVPNVPSSGTISLADDFYRSGNALTYTCYYSGGTSPVKTSWASSTSTTFNVSTYLGALTSGDTFIVCGQLTTGWPSGWYYSNASSVTIACTYGSSVGTTTTPYVASKQWFGYISYDGSDTVTIGGYYSGSSTGYPNGQIALQGIARTN